MTTYGIKWAVCVVLLAGFGCSDDSGAAPGTEGGACEAGGCDDGLACLSNLCVDPSGGSSAGGPDNASSSATGTGSAADGGNGSDTGEPGSDTAGTDGDGTEVVDAGADSGGAVDIQCDGSHPLLDGGARFCDENSCYCNDPFDVCFPADQAEACCNETPDCGDGDEPGGVICDGVHPITEPRRTCEVGSCMCSSQDLGIDLCFPMDVARTCCPPSIELDCVVRN